MLELMHYPEDLRDTSEFKVPAKHTPGREEMAMAKRLIGSMSVEWKPETYRDEYHEVLERIVDEKVRNAGRTPKAAPTKKKKASNVIDLVAVLQESLAKTKKKPATRTKKKTKGRAGSRRKAA